ncbi:MAG: hypothetical protein BWX92_02495 [Deltaproteobacteria bacterium ADurb.Bin135]|nr:MAG: hypothetical protein BWX92_02495 [Deltaproteobacteria bacterium ADurb.Bin135]
MNYEETIIQYLISIDSSLDMLSSHEEGQLSGLPSWVLQKRNIVIGVTEDNEGIAIKIAPDDNLEEDRIALKTIRTINDVSDIIAPMNYGGRLPNKEPDNGFIMMADMSVVETGNPLAVPVLDNRFLIGWGRSSGFFESFDIAKAKTEAISIWNNAKEGLGKNKNYVQETRKIFEKFQAIIKRKAFLERRIHRFVNEHKNIFLPSHKRCLFEHKLYLGEETRKADFIIEREQGLPSIFVELESPVHNVFTKNYDLTAQANHASQQISEWVKFVENDPMRNASGEYNFMTGPKERMVIIGLGVEDKERLINTKYGGITFWTYSIMLEEAKSRVNNMLSSQYKLLGIAEVRPF